MSRARRRQFLIKAGTLLAVPLPALAQQPAAAIPRVGFLGVATPAAWTTRVDALQAGFRDLGYVEGKNIVIEYRFAQGQYDRLPELAAELVRLKVDVIVTHSGLGAIAAKQATATNPIPVVMTNIGDAVGLGLVASLARPGVTLPATRSLLPRSRQSDSNCSRKRFRTCVACPSWRIPTPP